MTPRQKLMLFLISCDPGIRNDYDMIRLYDKSDFPANLTENLNPMLTEGLIKVSEFNYNSRVYKYEITEKGQSYLNTNFDETEIFDYIKTVHNPDHLMELTKTYINKKKTV